MHLFVSVRNIIIIIIVITLLLFVNFTVNEFLYESNSQPFQCLLCGSAVCMGPYWNSSSPAEQHKAEVRLNLL